MDSQSLSTMSWEAKSLSLHQLEQIESSEGKRVKKIMMGIIISDKIQILSQKIIKLQQTLKQLKEEQKNVKKQDKQLNNKIMLCIKSRLLKHFYDDRQYAKTKQTLDELLQLIKRKQQIEQVLVLFFGIPSFRSLIYYDVNSNLQYKCNNITKCQFLYVVGKISVLTHRNTQAIKVLKKCYEQCKNLNNFPFTVDVLAALIVDLKQTQFENDYNFYQKQRSSMYSDKFEKTSTYNIILKSFLMKETELQQKKQNSSSHKNIEVILWYLKRIEKKTQKIEKVIKSIENEKEQTVIKELLESKFYETAFATKLQSHLTYFYRKQARILFSFCISKCKESEIFVESQLKKKNKKTAQQIKKHFQEPENHLRARQVTKLCEKGAYLTKINFGNDSHAEKFLKLTKEDFRWAQDKKEIGYDASKCKWEKARFIVYGKATKNLCSKAHKDVEPWKCFSIIVKDRSYDFVCHKDQEVFLWLQGISYQLHCLSSGKNFPFYSKGRALWKMMLMKMKWRYLRNSKQNYKNENCGAIIEYSISHKK